VNFERTIAVPRLPVRYSEVMTLIAKKAKALTIASSPSSFAGAAIDGSLWSFCRPIRALNAFACVNCSIESGLFGLFPTRSGLNRWEHGTFKMAQLLVCVKVNATANQAKLLISYFKPMVTTTFLYCSSV
jgi:hypothetical protein